MENIWKNREKENLPLIVPLNYPKEYTILTEEFSLKIKESCMNNKIDYNILIDKIKMLESKKKNLEKKNKDELDEINIIMKITQIIIQMILIHIM